ncbi:MAG: hypothetical protein DRP89_01015 [Candidatus Neomarinimicrobiota bacterium]|nr:MAG: hypothetical protein DRP89_01015 [Candidatus Neomarinimicrobiota bacterium]
MSDEKFADFGDEESRINYLNAKFDDLLQGINNLYGKELMEELLRRLEKTISTFHQDVKSLIVGLQPDKISGQESKIISHQLESKQVAAEVSPASQAVVQEEVNNDSRVSE